MEWIFIWLLCGVTSAVIAAGKGRNAFGWFALGCLIAIFAIIMVACLPKIEPAAAEGEPDPEEEDRVARARAHHARLHQEAVAAREKEAEERRAHHAQLHQEAMSARERK